MNKRRWFLTGAGVLAALLLMRCARSCGGAGDDAEVLTAAAIQGPLVVSVRGSGEIMARESNKLIPQIKRPAELEFLVPEGQRVSKGEVVARFTTEEIDRQVADAETMVETAEQNLLSAQTDLEIQRMESATTLKLAEQALRAAQSELEKFNEGDEPMERRAAELKVTTTSSKYERNRKRHIEIQSLLQEGFVTEDQVEEERIGAETAEVEYETAKVELRTLKQFTLPLKRQTAEGAVAKATTELEKTRKTNEVQLRNREQAHEAAVRAVSKAKADLAKLQEDVQAYEVKATTDGVVTYGDPENPWRRSEIVVGSTIAPGPGPDDGARTWPPCRPSSMCRRRTYRRSARGSRSR
jgi:HlyD family secretion protein